METANPRPWYKKKRYIIPLGTLALLVYGAGLNGTPQASTVAPSAAVEQVAESQTVQKLNSLQKIQDTASVKPSVPKQPKASAETNLSNDNHYINSVGNTVHSPAYSDSVPAGASAQCRDGTYSFSQSRRGTCSHHGGVAQWL